MELTTLDPGYYYHIGYWVDLNGDGRLDFITARANSEVGGGQLLWLEHPEGGLDSTPWNEHIICSGPDVFTEVDYFDQYPGEIVVFAAEFFNENLSLYRVSLNGGTLVDSRVIDNGSILNAYSVSLVDLNHDGFKELLVNNHETDDETDGIWAYTLPTNLMTGPFEKITLLTDFKNKRSFTVPNMAPGFPYAVWPEVATQDTEIAHILVAGDGDYTFHSFGAVEPYNYSEDFYKDEGGTVGALCWADLDGDGWIEVFVPNYDSGYIEVYKTSPAASQLFLQ